jgi:transcriptional regulator with XRE-family HTH domain
VAPNSESAFGRIVRRRRKALGLSQEALAAEADLHRTFVSMIERGERRPSLEVVRKLASGLDTSAADLVAELEREAPR